MITKNDVILALSWSGETAELKNLTDYSQRHNIGLIAMTASPDSTLAKNADVVLALPQAREACPHNLAPTTSTLMPLASAMPWRSRWWKPRLHGGGFRHAVHPGGKLGTPAQLVRDLMHRALPSGRRSAAHVRRHPRDLRQGLRLRRRRRGAGLVGIVTDGDLRRNMRNNLLDARVDEVMTKAPKTVRPDQLISETLEILNSMKVTALFAVDAGKPVGIIHVHDLLRAGAA